MYRIGIDVGGTFTDLVAVDERGAVAIAKTASTPADQSAGVWRASSGWPRRSGSSGPRCSRGPSGSSTARRLRPTRCSSARARGSACSPPRVTATVLEIAGRPEGRPLRPSASRRRSRWCRASALAVRERLRADGRVETPLDEASLALAIAELPPPTSRRWRSATSMPIAMAATSGRRRKRCAALPEAYLSLSSNIPADQGVRAGLHDGRQLPSARRWSAISAASRCGSSRRATRGPVLIIQSHGGVATLEDAVRLAAGGVLSGPPGGVAGSRHAARLVGHPDLILFDMGGTGTVSRWWWAAQPRSPPTAGSPARRSRAAGARHRQHRGGRRLDRAGRCHRRRAARRGRKAPAPSLGPPAMARAAARRR